jgi:hypothetical protein
VKVTVLLILSVWAMFLAVSCGGADQPAADSPAGVWRRYEEASQKADVATMKSLLSKGSLAMLEASAENGQRSVDDLLLRESAVKRAKPAETGAEKIEGERATLEIRRENAEGFDALPFVREDGAWKIARDRYVEQFRKPTEKAGSTNAAPAAADSAANK